MAIVKFVEICEKIGSGATPCGGKEAYCKEGISLVRSQNILDFYFLKDGLAFINDEQARKLSIVLHFGDSASGKVRIQRLRNRDTARFF